MALFLGLQHIFKTRHFYLIRYQQSKHLKWPFWFQWASCNVSFNFVSNLNCLDVDLDSNNVNVDSILNNNFGVYIDSNDVDVNGYDTNQFNVDCLYVDGDNNNGFNGFNQVVAASLNFDKIILFKRLSLFYATA